MTCLPLSCQGFPLPSTLRSLTERVERTISHCRDADLVAMVTGRQYKQLRDLQLTQSFVEGSISEPDVLGNRIFFFSTKPLKIQVQVLQFVFWFLLRGRKKGIVLDYHCFQYQ
ncbi:hypothetical protein CEXT_452081 [Caerostris extrusa]|uniref:Uncharacterized protein n=1 Tax=Caerostris extrusa TaxID=172846 RepID=A0AAV4N179_CAEEX|nr:hypothetical protein CEXT_452081 [Caerostris extrusa]